MLFRSLLPPPRKHPIQSPLVLRSDSRPSSSGRIRFQSLDLSPRRLSTCHGCSPSVSTHPPRLKWTKVDISLHPPATNASLVPLRIENSGAALPCIWPSATGGAAYPVIAVHCSLHLLLSLVWTHTNAQSRSGPCVYRAYANLRKARRTEHRRIDLLTSDPK